MTRRKITGQAMLPALPADPRFFIRLCRLEMLLQRARCAEQAPVNLHDAAISEATACWRSTTTSPQCTFLDHFLADAESGREFAPYRERLPAADIRESVLANWRVRHDGTNY